MTRPHIFRRYNRWWVNVDDDAPRTGLRLARAATWCHVRNGDSAPYTTVLWGYRDTRSYP